MGSHIGGPRPIAELRTFARHAESVGLDSLWVFDHLLFRFSDQPESGAHEAWTTLTMLGAGTERIGIGSLMLGMRLRNPGLLAKMAVTLDEATGGRLTLGVGGGWHDPELEAFGWPTDHRLGRTEEGLHILRGLLDGQRVSFDGRWERADDAVLLPPPQRRIPILTSSKMGRMARFAARYADAWNGAWVARPDEPVLVERVEELRRACDEVGRDFAQIELTAGVSVRYPDADEPSPTRGRGDISGEPAQVAERLQSFAEAGYSQVIVWLGPMDGHGLDRLAEAVAIMRA
jgi:alkanesulfonate monooxygenase SsuD/methylene tetrahydromethanopterin reductase-like flavin-dependent oxidoreductase (luciferase family)